MIQRSLSPEAAYSGNLVLSVMTWEQMGLYGRATGIGSLSLEVNTE